MSYALNIDSTGRVLSVTFPQYAPADAPQVEILPDGDISEYRYQGGVFIHDPLPTPEPDTAPTVEERVAVLEEALTMILTGVTE